MRADPACDWCTQVVDVDRGGFDDVADVQRTSAFSTMHTQLLLGMHKASFFLTQLFIALQLG